MTNNLNVAEWIIVGILSFTLFVFLLLGIILLIKLIKLTKQAKKVVETSQSIADKVDDVADNIKDMTSIGGIARGYWQNYNRKSNNKRKVKRNKFICYYIDDINSADHILRNKIKAVNIHRSSRPNYCD